VVKFFSHDASELEPALALLEAADVSRGACGEDEEGGGAWEARSRGACRALLTPHPQTRSVVLLWLSLLVLIPFDLAAVDSSLTGEEAAGSEAPLARALHLRLRAFLDDPGPLRARAADALARLLSRPDVATQRAAFLGWAGEELAAAEAGPACHRSAAFRLPGAAAALAGLLKHAPRAALSAQALQLRDAALRLGVSPAAAASPLLRKLAVKLAARAGALLLPAQAGDWRARRAARRLLGGGAAGGPAAPAPPEEAAARAAAPALEPIFQMLLRGLGDGDTPVRWAAAKACARLAARLPGDLRASVAASALAAADAAAARQEDGALHGALLALAELCRRGCLEGELLRRAQAPVAAALAFDLRRGAHSVGAHVRDAACFACWAAARAGGGSREELARFARALAPPLLAAAALDREVNVRRAAAAAFQELAGRLGSGGDGPAAAIDAVQLADYFSLGSRARAYTRVAPALARLDERYWAAMVGLLLGQKTSHWDAAVRGLAAQALPTLLPLRAARLAEEALPPLLRAAAAAGSEPGARAGAIMALAALAPPLAADRLLPPDAQRALLELPGALAAQRAFRGRGGELLRCASAQLTASAAAARLPSTEPGWMDAQLAALEEGLRSSAEETAAQCARGIGALACAAYGPCCNAISGCACPPPLPAPEAWAGGCSARYAAGLAAPPAAAAPEAQAVRRGAARALASLPPAALRSGGGAAVAAAAAAACAGAGLGEGAEGAEARAECVRALSHILGSLGLQSADGPGADLVQEQLLPSLLLCLDDYSVDRRGDVGSWVREAALIAIPPALQLLLAAGGDGHALAQRCICAALKQAGERIDRVRAAAAAALAALLAALPADAALPGGEELRRAFPAGGGPAYASPAHAFPRLAPLLRLAPYTQPLTAGLLLSVGGLGDSAAQQARCAMLSAMEDPGCAAAAAAAAADALAAAAGLPRVALPALRTLEAMLGGAAALAPGASEAAEAARARALAAAAPLAARSRDVPLLMAAAGCLAQLAAAGGCASGRREALVAAARLLGSPYPRVRRAAAEALYLRLLGEPPAEGEDGDRAEALLAETSWDGEAEAEAARAELHEALALGPPPPVRRAAPRRREEELGSSYASLVEDAGY